MSRSPPRAASVSSHTWKPSGSSVAIEPASTQLRVGDLLAHDAERLDHADRVLPRVEPAHLARRSDGAGRCRTACVISWQNGIASSRFFTDSGSMHGGACTTRSIVERRRGRTPASSTPTRRAARRTGGRTPTPSGFASVRSMWQRQIHFVCRAASLERSARKLEHRGGLRVVDDHEVPLALEQQRVVEHLLEVDALHLRRSTRSAAPCSALCTVLGDAEELVAAVDHLPLGVDARRSRSSGTWVASSSATPPPYAVALRCSTRAPCERLGELRGCGRSTSAPDDRRGSRRGPSRAGGRVRAPVLLVARRGVVTVNLCGHDRPQRSLPRQVPRHAHRPPRPRPRWPAGCGGPGSTTVRELPLADGGEGTLDALLAARGGSRRTHPGHRPAGRPGRRRVGAAGRRHRGGGDGPGERPRARRRAATIRCGRPPAGTGELIAAALARGCARG